MRQLPCPILVVFHRPFHQTTKKSGHRSMAFYVSCDSWHCKIQTQSSGNESVAYRPTSLRERKILNFSRPLKFATFGKLSFLIIFFISFLQFDSTVLTLLNFTPRIAVISFCNFPATQRHLPRRDRSSLIKCRQFLGQILRRSEEEVEAFTSVRKCMTSTSGGVGKVA